MAKRKLIRWFFALAILLSGIVASFYAAEWIQAALGLPSFAIKSRHGSVTDLVVLAIALCLFIGYLYIVPKLLRVDHDELSRMMRGE